MGAVRGRTWLLQLTDLLGGGVACPCRQRSTWPGTSARGSSNKDQPVWRTQQSTGHLLHTHVHTLLHTHTYTHRGSHLFTTCSHAFVPGVSYIICKGQTCKWQLIETCCIKHVHQPFCNFPHEPCSHTHMHSMLFQQSSK